eukprot:2822601-Alexandrium_andersonii.AAC.1
MPRAWRIWRWCSGEAKCSPGGSTRPPTTLQRRQVQWAVEKQIRTSGSLASPTQLSQSRQASSRSTAGAPGPACGSAAALAAAAP